MKLISLADKIVFSSIKNFEHGEINNGVLMAAAGKYGYYLGEVKITIENGKIVDKIAKIHPIETLPLVETHFEEEGRALLSKPTWGKMARSQTLNRTPVRDVDIGSHMACQTKEGTVRFLARYIVASNSLHVLVLIGLAWNSDSNASQT